MSNDARTEPADENQPRSFLGRWLKITPGDILRLVLICVVVGLILAAFRVDPRRLWVDFFGTMGKNARIAPLEPHDDIAFKQVFFDQIANILLLLEMMVARLADRDFMRVFARILLKEYGRNQPVMQNNISL